MRPLWIIVFLETWLKKDQSLNMRGYLKRTTVNRPDVINIMNPSSQLPYPVTAQVPTGYLETGRHGNTSLDTGRTEVAGVSLFWWQQLNLRTVC